MACLGASLITLAAFSQEPAQAEIETKCKEDEQRGDKRWAEGEEPSKDPPLAIWLLLYICSHAFVLQYVGKPF